MTEAQVKAIPAFRTLPFYDESDPQSDGITTIQGGASFRAIRECTTLQDVLDSLKNPRLVPLGALRAGPPGQQVVVVYFGYQP